MTPTSIEAALTIVFFISLFLIALGSILSLKKEKISKISLVLISFGFALIPPGSILPYVYYAGRRTSILFLEIGLYYRNTPPCIQGVCADVLPKITVINILFLSINFIL
jgi:hypothetical protein